MSTPERHARLAADRRLRARILDLLYQSRANDSEGYISGRYLADVMEMVARTGGTRVDDERLISLARDLSLKGLVVERDDRIYRQEPHALDTLSYAITAAGVSQVEGTTPADPDIDDGRRARA